MTTITTSMITSTITSTITSMNIITTTIMITAIFDSIGFETSRKFTQDGIKAALEALDENSKYGTILRAKGIVAGEDGQWIHFDYVPGESDIRTGAADVTGKLCVIGAEVNKEAVKELFGL